MINDRLKNIYDDLYDSSKGNPAEEDLEKAKQELMQIFEETERLTKASMEPFTSDKTPGSGSGNSQGTDERLSQKANGQPDRQAEAQAAKEAAEAEAEPETDPMEELDSLIGLKAIKHDVKELIAFVKIQKLREENGLKSAPVSLHLVFTGNPGTGKTTVARIIAKLYKQIGVLSKGQLVEVDRSGLVAGYVGQTAIKTRQKIEEAMGGILFIDEAYALAKEGQDFGQEAIDTILKAMEDNRSDFVVIVAGYTEPMQQFIESNPGLKSRFNKYIEFADYTMEELTGIFQSFCDKYDYVIDEENLERVTNLLRIKRAETLENFANAREVRNLFEQIITNQARRLNEMDNPTIEDMRTLLYEDLFDTETETPSQPDAEPEDQSLSDEEAETPSQPDAEPEDPDDIDADPDLPDENEDQDL